MDNQEKNWVEIQTTQGNVKQDLDFILEKGKTLLDCRRAARIKVMHLEDRMN